MLTPGAAEQRAAHPDKDAAPAQQAVAHAAWEPNLHGNGYAQAWRLDAINTNAVEP